MKLLKKAFGALKTLVQSALTTEPALVVGAVVAVVGAVVGALGIVVPIASVSQIVGYVVAVLGGAVTIRSQVSPS
jgi:hypothetical protein